MLPIVTKILASNITIEETQKELVDVVKATSIKKLNVQDEFGDTLLIKCCRLEYNLVIDALIEKKVNIDLPNKNGINPILLSVMKENLPLTEQLIKAKCNIEHADNRGQTALIWVATNQKNSNTLSLLIENEAKIDVVDTQKNTPLHLATANDMMENCKLLLQHGAKFDALNDNFFTPFEFAVDNKNREITQLFFSTIEEFKDLAYIDKFCYSASQEHKDFIQSDFDNTILRLRLNQELHLSDKNHKKLKI
jgi:ankyrin repeat protein